jgi:hypothetical protein
MAQEEKAPMHDHPKGARDECAIATSDEDDREQAAILQLVLELHPATLSQDELVSGLTAESAIEYGYDEGDRLTEVSDTASGEYTLSHDNLAASPGSKAPAAASATNMTRPAGARR